MKKLYIKPKVEINITVCESSLLAGTGVTGKLNDDLSDELSDGGSGDGLEGDVNRNYLWDDLKTN